MSSHCLLTAALLILLTLQTGATDAQGTPPLTSLTLDAASVMGGTPVQGTVILGSAPLLRGTVVFLLSSHPSVAVVADSVTVPVGSNSQRFNVETRPVKTATVVTVTASRFGVTLTAELRVLPEPASGQPAPQPGAEVGSLVNGPGTLLGNPEPGDVTSAPGETVLAPPGRFFFDPVPNDVDRDERAIRRFADDGSLYTADSGGTAILRLPPPPAAPEVLLDTSAVDPVDGAGLARLLRVEKNPSGVSAVLALRADNRHAVYRLENRRLTRLALLADAAGRSDEEVPPELAISDAGQIAFAARAASGGVTVFQERPGGGNPQPVVQVVEGAAVDGVGNLQTNASGDLVFLAKLGLTDETELNAILRKTASGVAVVARLGQAVERSRGAGVTQPLATLRRPRLGLDGTVVFVGGDPYSQENLFVNFYLARPGRPLQALLPGTDWSLFPVTLDLDIATDGAIAIRAAVEPSIVSELHLVAPNGTVTRIEFGALEPKGRPVFGPEGRLFILADDPTRPRNRDGRPPVDLYRVRYEAGGRVGPLEPVAVHGQAVPGKPGAQVLSVRQHPSVSPDALALEIQYGSTGPGTVPAAAFLRVPFDGSAPGGLLLAEEGTVLPNANRLALLRELSYQDDGTLVIGGLQPGAGPLLAAVTPARIASTARTQAVQQSPVELLLGIGQPLDRPDRQLQAVVSPPVALGRDRQLLAARYNRGGVSGEGLFTLHRSRQVQAVAATDDPPGPAGAPFAAFADNPTTVASTDVRCDALFTSANAGIVGLPSVFSSDSLTHAVFKARLSGNSRHGVFQWKDGALLTVALETDELVAGKPGPYGLERWVASADGAAYLMARPPSGPSCLFRRTSSRLETLVVPGVTPVMGGLRVTDLQDFVLTADGALYLISSRGLGGGDIGLFRVEPGGLRPIVVAEQPLPRFADGPAINGRQFGNEFGLMPDSTRGALLFRASVFDAEGLPTGQRGLFRLGSQGLEALLVEGLSIAGARSITADVLADSLDRQTRNGTTVYAARSNNRGWVLYRSRVTRNSLGEASVITEALAQEGSSLSGVPGFVTMDPTLLLSLPCRSGPLFSLNDSGAVALLASNGTRWGLYLFPPP